jgi:hypothetical protein
MRNAYKVLVGNRERNEALGRPRRSWANNSRMDVRKIALEVVDWMHLAQDRDQWWTLVNTVMNH